MPGAHSAVAVAAVVQKVPAGQSMHCSREASPPCVLYVPEAHGRAADVPSGQYEPAGQSKHAVWPLAFMNLPEAQLEHEDCFVRGLMVPGAHSVAVALPTLHQVPSGQVSHWLTSVITLTD